MSKLVSDLFDISEFAHHGPENLFISDERSLVHLFFFCHQEELALPLRFLSL